MRRDLGGLVGLYVASSVLSATLLAGCISGSESGGDDTDVAPDVGSARDVRPAEDLRSEPDVPPGQDQGRPLDQGGDEDVAVNLDGGPHPDGGGPDQGPEPDAGSLADVGIPDLGGDPIDDAVVVSAELPEALACGATFTLRIVMRNTGNTLWTEAERYRLGMVDDQDPFFPPGSDTRLKLPDEASVAPGGTWEFVAELRAPAAPGRYVTDWRMVHEAVQWFGASASSEVAVACEAPPAQRHGPVRLDDGVLVDDDGPFNALGTTLMWGAWAYKFDRPRLDTNLAAIADAGFDYVRLLGVVGDPDNPDYWDGREIDWRWPDYAEVIAGLTDLAYDRYGLRVQWTLIGDGQIAIPHEQDRYALADGFLAMAAGREQKIILLEVANEAWQNGFAGDDGVAQLRALTVYLRDRTDILVAASAPQGHECDDYQRIYGGGVADIATIHFDRNVRLRDGHWRPVRQPWELAYCEGMPPGSNNEPIGPGASVAEEADPLKLVSAAIATYVCNLPMYVYHTSAGVRGDAHIFDMPGFHAFGALRTILPPDLVGWSRRNAHWDNSSFVVYAEDPAGEHADTMWPDLRDATSGTVRAYGDVNGDEFLVFVFGILNRVLMEPRRAMRFEVIDPITGAQRAEYDLAAGERFELSGSEALLLRGRYR